MDIHQKLVPILKDIQFASRYFELCKNHSDFENSLNEYDKSIIKNFIEDNGLKVTYVKSDNFYKVIEKSGELTIQFNIIPKRGFIQFVLDVKEDNERMNLGWGMWESITRELEGIIAKKPLFSSIEELEEILKKALEIYTDFKSELFKNTLVKDQLNLLDSNKNNTEINITRIDVKRTIISSDSNEKKFYLEEHILKLNQEVFSILIEDSKIITELKEELNNNILELVLSQTNAKKNMLGGYDSIDNFSLRYLLIDNYLLVISSGETQPHLFKLFLEGCWKIDNINNTEVL